MDRAISITSWRRLKYFAAALFLAMCFTVSAANMVLAGTHSSIEKKKFREQNYEVYSDDSCSESSSGGSSGGSTAQPGGSSVPADADGWTFPTAPGTPISSDYKAPDRPGHRGVDLAGPLGTPVYASRDGTVVFAGDANDPNGFGNWVVIQHEENGQRVDSVYGHMPLNSITVKPGDKVQAGQQIATIGSEGGSSGPHLHYEEWNGGRQGGSERQPVAVYGGAPAPSQTPNANQAATPTPSGTSPFAGASAQGCATATTSSSGGPCHQPAPGEDSAKIVWDYLIGQGFSSTQAAAIMGNLAHEGGDPTFKHATDAYEVGGANAGYGIAQWSFSRQTQLRDAAATQGKDVKDLCFQLDYLMQEMKSRTLRDGGGQSEYDGMKAQTSLQDAVHFFEYNFERPSPGSTGARTRYAQQYLDKYGTSGNVRV